MQSKQESFDSDMTEYLQIEQEVELKQLFKHLKIQNSQVSNKQSKKIKKFKLNIQTNSIIQRRSINLSQI
ncbi:unnamed protein product (macronuclear) [Paramecium tetraurelia]|uniref:Uncharacterized protein n=1 Tax=Paramecium tetraurelia TaxID=5888 RepID=A0DX03_PARTE|nr:uncharacterized protein GSPATT00021202001 [Paramecium tetraurelia]CAK87570.1 unnamed protein product [Paramecium tetraurelia]|eukprot:XP_001454967.1 hypothetical protein (macronuclear) [Paramecium tetraurelia strain d4-2]